MRSERYIDNYDRVRIAVHWDEYDEGRKDALKEIDWDVHHGGYDNEYKWRDEKTRDFTWTMDYSDEAIELLREASGERVPAEPGWNVDIYDTAPGDNPRECQSCREERVLGIRGLKACNLHRSTAAAVLEDTEASQVCRACGQFYRFIVHEGHEKRATDGGISGGTAVHEVM